MTIDPPPIPIGIDHYMISPGNKAIMLITHKAALFCPYYALYIIALCMGGGKGGATMSNP